MDAISSFLKLFCFYCGPPWRARRFFPAWNPPYVLQRLARAPREDNGVRVVQLDTWQGINYQLDAVHSRHEVYFVRKCRGHESS